MCYTSHSYLRHTCNSNVISQVTISIIVIGNTLLIRSRMRSKRNGLALKKGNGLL